MLLDPAARAALIFDGQTLGYNYRFPNQSSLYFDPGDITVGSGVELPGVYSAFSDVANLDISDTNVVAHFNLTGGWSAASFNGFRIFDKYGVLSPFSSVAVNPATNMAGFTAANVSFDDDNIYVNWQGLSFSANTVVSLDVQTTATVTPEPAMTVIWSIVVGVGAIYGRRRRLA